MSALQLHLYFRFVLAVLDKVTKSARSPQHARRVAQTQTDGADQGALSRAVGPDDHVEIGAKREFGLLVCDKVLDLNPYDGSGLKFIFRGTVGRLCGSRALGSSASPWWWWKVVIGR